MKKLLLPIVLITFATAVNAVATVSITVNSNGGPKYVSSTGADLALGNVIRVGTFDISGGTSVLSMSNSFATLDALFTPLAEMRAGGGTATGNNGVPPSNVIINNTGSPGHVFAQITNVAGNYFAQGTQLYTWVFNSATPSTATEWGIFSSSNVLWDFPPDLGSATLSTSTADIIYRGSAEGGALRLAVVPEPSVSALALGVGLLLVTMRRRN